MSAKQITLTIPEKMLKEIDRAAKSEHRSRAEFLREAARRSIAAQSARAIPVVKPTAEEERIMRKGEEEIARGEFVTLEQLRHDVTDRRR